MFGEEIMAFVHGKDELAPGFIKQLNSVQYMRYDEGKASFTVLY